MTIDMVAAEGGLASKWIAIDGDEAIKISNVMFGINGSAIRFATEKDDTFKISCDNGDCYILKVANPEESHDEISFQISLLEHISNKSPSLPVPRMLVNKNGNFLSKITVSSGESRFVRMLSFLDGTPLDRISSTPDGRFKIGCMLGKLRHSLEGFSHASDERVLAWDVKHLLSLKSLLDHVHDLKKRNYLIKALDRFADINPKLVSLRKQVLHNDFSKSNIVVDPNSPEFVTGVIDFGDAVRTLVAIDVSTALLNQLPPVAQSDLFQEGRDLLNGYLSIADLTEEELEIIPHLVMGRIVARALITIWRSQIMPENATYILRNTEQGWSQLEWFLDRSVLQVSQSLI